LGTLETTSGGTERHIRMLGYNSSYVSLRTNTGFNSNYNAFNIIVNSNSTDTGQGNTSIPSWEMVVGGNIPNEDSFYIGRSAPGSFSFTTLFKLSSTGAATFSSSVTANDTVSINTDVTMLRFGNLLRWGFQRPAADNRYVSFMRNMNATATPVWTVDGDNGNVGIGNTGNSSRRLEVSQPSGYSAGIRIIADASANATLQFLGTGGSSQPDIGVTSASPNDLQFGTGGSERMRITSGGNVGVGTTDIDAKFKIFSNSEANLMLSTTTKSSVNLVAQTQAIGLADLDIEANNIKLYTGTIERMRITSGGDIRITSGGTTNAATLELTSDATPSNGSIIGVSYLGSGSYGPLRFATGGSERMRITSGGDVGINTTFSGINTASLLTIKAAVADGNQIYIVQSNDDRGWRMKAKNDGHFYLQSAYSSGNSDVLKACYDTGNVLIGTTTDNGYKLNVNGTGRFASMIYGFGGVRIDGGNGNTSYTPDGLWGASATPNFIATTGYSGAYGNALNGQSLLFGYADNGSGLYSPAYGFQVKSTDGAGVQNRVVVAIRIKDVDKNTYPLTIYNNGAIETSSDMTSAAGYIFNNQTGSGSFTWYGFGGNIYAYSSSVGNIANINGSTGAYTAISDVNKKKDLELSNLGLDAVMGLKPTFYRMNSENGTEKHLGFIAQEVKDYIPQAYVKSGDFIGLNEMPIIAALTKAIQEQQDQIEKLKSQLNK
jgi:hypothetical protein